MLSNISIQVLDQLAEQLSRLRVDQFSTKLSVFNGSSVGDHARHVIEFYDCLLAGLETGEVNYDARQRDLQIAQNRDYALRIIEKIVEKLGNRTSSPRSLTLTARFGEEVECCIPTSFEREEVYLIEHSIHHFALIRIGIQENWPEMEVISGFGFAHSTLQFRNPQPAIKKCVS